MDIGSCLPPSVRLRPARHYHGQPIGTNCEPTCTLQLIWGQLWDNFFSWELHNFSKELGQYSTVQHSKVQYSTDTFWVISLQLLLNISQFRHNYRVPLLANSWQVLSLSWHTEDVVLGELIVSLKKIKKAYSSNQIKKIIFCHLLQVHEVFEPRLIPRPSTSLLLAQSCFTSQVM